MKEKENVLFINHSVRDGGPGRSLFYILKYINRNKIEPFVLIPKDDLFSEDLKKNGLYKNIIIDNRFPENLQRPRLNIQNNQNLMGKYNFLSKLCKYISIIINIFELILLVNNSSKIIKKNMIDIIYCNGTIAKVVGAFIGKKNSIPVVWHVRNIQQTIFLKFLIKSLSKFDVVKKIICVSKATASQFNEVKDKVNVVYNGVDSDEYNNLNTKGSLRKEYSIPKDALIIGNTGRIVPRKGYINFVDIANQIIKSNADKNIMFALVGDTPHFFPKNHLDEIKAYAKSLNITEKFIFTGYKRDIKPYLKDFDIFVIPSNYPDPFPRSVIEAMSFAVPVVGFKIGGIAEAIDNGITGYLCKTNGFNDMKESIQTLINDGRLREKMGANSRKKVQENYLASDITKDIEKIVLTVN